MDRINKNHALQKKAVSPNFETDTHKIVRVAYDDEGTNMFVLVDKKNKEIVSYSISGNSERDKFSKLQENKMESRKTKLLENFIRREVRKNLKEENITDFKGVMQFANQNKIRNRIWQIDQLLSKLSTINDLRESGVHPDRLMTFFTDLSKKLENVEFLTNTLEKELK